jgi:hypothetical protein
MGLLEGDTALVTGAASGIGGGIARALAAEGTRLVLTDVAAQNGAAVAREVNAEFIAADLADRSAPRRLFEAAVKALGSISIFVHSASPKRHEREMALAVTESEWDAMTTVGLRAGFVLGQAVGAHMKARKIKGRMLFVTSLHAYTPRNLPHYSATKGRPDDARKRTGARAWRQRHSRQCHCSRGNPGRRICCRRRNAYENDSTWPDRNAGRRRRYGYCSAMRSIFSLRDRHHRCGGRRDCTLQLDPGANRLMILCRGVIPAWRPALSAH